MTHRASLSGGAACNKPGRVSYSGLLVDCPECLALQARPSPERVMEIIHEAARLMRQDTDRAVPKSLRSEGGAK